MSPYKIAVIPADGIGPEVVDAGIEVLQALAAKLNLSFEFTNYDWNSETYKTTGAYIPAGGLDDLKRHDAILFGAVGAPGMSTFYDCRDLRNLLMPMLRRCPRPHLPLGPPTSNLPTISAIRQCPTDPYPPRHPIPPPQLPSGIARLGHCPRK